MSFQHLPDELRRLILSFVGGTLATNWTPRNSDIHAFARVCRSWREIALCTPDLWRNITITFPALKPTSHDRYVDYIMGEELKVDSDRVLEYLPVWIQRSNQLLLDIDLVNNVPYDWAPNTVEDFNRMWEYLLLVAPRWKSLKFIGEFPMCSAFLKRFSEAISLESLHLQTYTDDDSSSRYISSLTFRWPKLKHLSLYAGLERLPSLDCPLLETVSMAFSQISLVEICKLASVCPYLIDLTISTLHLNANFRHGDVTNFPNLRSCCLPGDHGQVIDMLLAAPLLETLALNVRSLLTQSNARTLPITHLNLHLEQASVFMSPSGTILTSCPQLSHLSVQPSAKYLGKPIAQAIIEILTIHTRNRAFNLQDLKLKSLIVLSATVLQFSAAAKACNISSENCDPIAEFEFMRFEELRGLLAQDGHPAGGCGTGGLVQ